MALKYAGGSSDGATIGTATGSTTYNSQHLQYTLSAAKSDILGITNYSTIDGINRRGFLGDPEGNPIGCGCGSGCGIEHINIYTQSGTWYRLKTNNTFTNHALGDIAGKENTTVVSAFTLSNYPAFAACLQYYTSGTQAGDWYLPALGELAFVCVNKEIINAKLASIIPTYAPFCMNSLYDICCWTSSESDNVSAYVVSLGDGDVAADNKYNYNYYVIPMLQA